jgi:hypothetical protein
MFGGYNCDCVNAEREFQAVAAIVGDSVCADGCIIDNDGGRERIAGSFVGDGSGQEAGWFGDQTEVLNCNCIRCYFNRLGGVCFVAKG